MFGNDGVSQSSHDSDISRQSKRTSAIEIRIQLIEETINSDPKLKEAYQKAWTKQSEKRMKDDLSWMKAGL